MGMCANAETCTCCIPFTPSTSLAIHLRPLSCEAKIMCPSGAWVPVLLQDPFLNGNAPRTAWLLTREAVGHDLLAGAAGALAAASMFLRSSDPNWAAQALVHARYL